MHWSFLAPKKRQVRGAFTDHDVQILLRAAEHATIEATYAGKHARADDNGVWTGDALHAAQAERDLSRYAMEYTQLAMKVKAQIRS